MNTYTYTNANFSSIGTHGKHRTSPTVSPIKEHERKQNILYGTSVSHASKVSRQKIANEKRYRKDMNKKFDGVVQREHTAYFKLLIMVMALQQ